MEASRRLACKRCQTRKIKCDRVQPCSNCVQSGRPCEYRTQDGRKNPVSHRYLSALEARLSWFESFIKELKQASHEERDRLLESVNLEEHKEIGKDFGEAQETNAQSTLETCNAGHTISLLSAPQGILQFHGPTSIYLDGHSFTGTGDAGASSLRESSSLALHSWSIVRLASSLGVDDGLIQECLPLFFLHQYFYHMFIYREAFVLDFYENKHGGRYWSFPLVYAMCALGAPHSKDQNIREKSPILAKCAQEILITHCLSRPCPTTIQALLCLASHEVGQGNASQGWLFSGMAFRMGEDLGFHQDPSGWISQDNSIITPEDIEIRRRIYWGSYTADKFISLYLGRPVYLLENDATVQPTVELPDPEERTSFGMPELVFQYTTKPQKPQLFLGFQYIALLGKIFQDMMTEIFSRKNHTRSNSILLSRLDQLNIRLSQWQKDLPESLQWSQWAPSSKSTYPYVLITHLYHSALSLSLNRHFVLPSRGFPLSPSARSNCTSSCEIITALIRQYRSQHGLHTAPLMLVYALVMSIITMVSMLKMGPESVYFHIKALDECAQRYKLAKEAQIRVQKFVDPVESAVGKRNKTSNDSAHQARPAEASEPSHEFNSAPNLSLDGAQLLHDFSNVLGLESLAHEDVDGFSFSGLDDMSGDFSGWFSIGQMG